MRTYANSVFPATTLNGNINNSVTSLTLFSEANLPGVGQYVISMGSELMLVTAGWGTLTLTVTRGIEGTTAASHTSGDPIYHPMTAGVFDAMRADQRQRGTYANLPATATSKKGDRYRCTDAPYTFEFDGSLWIPTYREWDVTVPQSSGWSWEAQSSSTVDQTKGQIYLNLEPRSGANQIRGYYRTAPATPFKVTFCMSFSLAGIGEASSSGNNMYFGPMFRDATGKLQVFGFGVSSNTAYITVDNWTSNASYSSTPALQYTAYAATTVVHSNPHWLRIQDTGTNLLFEYSIDGFNWHTFFTQARSTWFSGGPGPNAYGVGAFVYGDPVKAQIISISES